MTARSEVEAELVTFFTEKLGEAEIAKLKVGIGDEPGDWLPYAWLTVSEEVLDSADDRMVDFMRPLITEERVRIYAVFDDLKAEYGAGWMKEARESGYDDRLISEYLVGAS